MACRIRISSLSHLDVTAVDPEVKKAGGVYSTRLARNRQGGIATGYYATHLRMWWRHFARRSFFIASFRQLTDEAQTNATLQRIFAFAKLGPPRHPEAPVEEKANEKPWPGKLARRSVSSETQCVLFAMYQAEMKMLPSLINANTTVNRTSWYGVTDADKQPPPEQPLFEKLGLRKCENVGDARGGARNPTKKPKPGHYPREQRKENAMPHDRKKDVLPTSFFSFLLGGR